MRIDHHDIQAAIETVFFALECGWRFGLAALVVVFAVQKRPMWRDLLKREGRGL